MSLWKFPMWIFTIHSDLFWACIRAEWCIKVNITVVPQRGEIFVLEGGPLFSTGVRESYQNQNCFVLCYWQLYRNICTWQPFHCWPLCTQTSLATAFENPGSDSKTLILPDLELNQNRLQVSEFGIKLQVCVVHNWNEVAEPKQVLSFNFVQKTVDLSST